MESDSSVLRLGKIDECVDVHGQDHATEENDHPSKAFIELDPVISKLEYILLWNNRVLSILFLLSFDVLMFLIRPLRPLPQFCTLMACLVAFDGISRMIGLFTNEQKSKCCRLTRSLYRLTKFERRKTLTICLAIGVLFYFLNGKPIGLWWHTSVVLLFLYPNLMLNGLPPKIRNIVAGVLMHLDAAMKYERRSILIEDEDDVPDYEDNGDAGSDVSSSDDSELEFDEVEQFRQRRGFYKRSVLVDNTMDIGDDEYEQVVLRQRSKYGPRSSFDGMGPTNSRPSRISANQQRSGRKTISNAHEEAAMKCSMVNRG